MSDKLKIEEELRLALKEFFPSWSHSQREDRINHLLSSCPDNPVVYKVLSDKKLIKVGLRDSHGKLHYYVAEKDKESFL